MSRTTPSLTTLSHATAYIGAAQHEQAEFLTNLAVSPHDTVTLQAGEDNSIKGVREFANQMLLSPQFGPTRLGVIYRADLLTPQAQNALLKLLEEPPVRAKLILFLGQEGGVLPTVLSRCQRYYGQSVKTLDVAVAGYDDDALQQFLAAETLAKEEDLSNLAHVWLQEQYAKWCAAGRPTSGLSTMLRFWHFYQGVQIQGNKKLLLEQLVVSSL